MDSTLVQLTLKFIILSQNCIYFSGPFYFVYLDSWVKAHNPEASYSKIYWAVTVFDVGIPMANVLIPYLVPYIGLRPCLQLAGPLVAFSCYFYYVSTSIYALYATALVVGMAHQFFIICLLELINKKYRRDFLVYMGRVFSSISVSRGLYNLVSMYVVNPLNIRPSEFLVIDGYKEYFFPAEVTSRFPRFLLIVAVVNMFTASFLSLFVTDPTYLRRALYLWMNKNSSNEVCSKSQKKLKQMVSVNGRVFCGETPDGDKSERLFFSEPSDLKDPKNHINKTETLIALQEVVVNTL